MLSRLSESRRRRRYAKDLERRMRELDRLDREHGLGALPSAERLREVRRREGLSTLSALVLTFLFVAAVIAFAPGNEMRVVRQALGFDSGRPLPIPALTDGDGSYAFMATQRGSSDPVGYSPCDTIEVEVNPTGAPDNWETLLDDGIAHIEEASGLDLEVVGTTDQRPGEHLAGPPGRRPVLVSWATADEVPALAGRIAGLGGSTPERRVDGRLYYVTGSVTLDADAFADFRPIDARATQAIVDHELGHLVGLAHVDDGNELMYEDNIGVTSWGPGDLEGLARLGRIGC